MSRKTGEPEEQEELTASINNWTVHWVTEFHYVIWGEIVGDSKGRWADGTTFHTSAIQKRYKAQEGAILPTVYSTYKLLKPITEAL